MAAETAVSAGAASQVNAQIEAQAATLQEALQQSAEGSEA